MTRTARPRADVGPAADRSLPPLPHCPIPDPAARDALDAAMRLLERVEDSGRPAELAQTLTQVGQALLELRALDAAEGYFARALRWAGMLGVVDARVDLLCTLAEVACAQSQAADGGGEDPMVGRRLRERARDRAYEAASIAGQVTDAQWEVRVLLRVSDVLESCGDHHDALTMQTRAIALLGLDAGGPVPERGDLHALTAPGQLM